MYRFDHKNGYSAVDCSMIESINCETTDDVEWSSRKANGKKRKEPKLVSYIRYSITIKSGGSSTLYVEFNSIPERDRVFAEIMSRIS